VLSKMEDNSNFVRHVFIPFNIPVLDIMSEKGPFTSVTENQRFKSDQRRFVKESPNRTLLFVKGSAHNIPQDKPQMVIDQIISFYKKHS
jgi:pimeloyl-ACP methyl ester carboxylesterase